MHILFAFLTYGKNISKAHVYHVYIANIDNSVDVFNNDVYDCS